MGYQLLSCVWLWRRCRHHLGRKENKTKNPDPVLSLRYVTGMSNAIGGCHVETIRSIVAAFHVVVQSDLIRRLITD